MQWCSTLSTLLEWMHVHSLSQWVLNSAAGTELHAKFLDSGTFYFLCVYACVWGKGRL